MSQITLEYCINEIIDYARTGTTATVSFGSPDKLSSAEISYPHIRVNYISTNIEEKRIIYNFSISCSDLKTHDDSDLITAYSATANILHNLTAYFKQNRAYYNRLKVEYPFRIYAASSQFLDGVPTSVLDFSISVQNATCINN